VRKVFGIVTVQMLCTFFVLLAASSNYEFGLWVQQLWVQLTSLFVYLFSFIPLFCMGNLRKQVPLNYLFLFIITFSMAFLIGAITAYVTVKSLLFCIGVLCVSVVSLCGAALVTPLSAKLVMFLLVGLMVGCLLQLVALIALCVTGYYGYWWILYGTLGMAISGILLFIDVIKIQILGKVAVDEYILGALLLYIDIIRLLLYILMLFGKGK